MSVTIGGLHFIYTDLKHGLSPKRINWGC